MRDFLDYIFDHELNQLLEGVESHQPMDGQWDEDGDTYRFNVPGDDCNTCSCTRGKDGVGRCYSLEIGGTPESGISIAFYRGGSTSDAHKGVGMDVFKGILRGLSDYISTHKPAKIYWSAVRKSSPNPFRKQIVNPEARAHVYEGWAVRHLFPEKYIGMQGNWIRRDIYDKEYVPNGYPPVPAGLTDNSNPSEKRQALEDMKEKARLNQEEIARRQREREEAEEARRAEEEARRREEIRRQREEAQRRRLERLQQELQDPEKNPSGLQVDDIVYLKDPDDNYDYDYANRIGKIEQFMHGDRYEGDSDTLSAQVRWASDEEDADFSGGIKWFPIVRLKKETPEGKVERERNRQEKMTAAIADPEKNPNGVQEGDDIITQMDNPHSAQHGLLGKLKQIKMTRYGIEAYVDWDDAAKETLGYRHENSVRMEFLKKATPEVVRQVQQARRQYDIDQEIERNRERHSRPVGPEIEQPEDLQAVINHPGNPLHLKPGDHVIYDGYVRGRRWGSGAHKGYIVSINVSRWDENRVEAQIRLHGSTARRPVQVWNISQLQRDESPESQAILARQQQRQQRQQRLSGATGGHNIGDSVTVVSGIHRGKSGRIVSFRMSGQNASAVIAQLEGPNINVRISALQPPANTPAPTAENFSFRDYLTYIESRLVA